MALAATTPLTAQTRSPLEFMGLKPGMPGAELKAQITALGGQLSCSTSRVDSRFSECRGTINPGGEGEYTVTASVVSGSTAVVLITGDVDDPQLGRWVDDLTTRYGQVSARVANTQAMWQWVRQRRMIRVTTRIESGIRVVSVSLVDGIILDGLGGG